MEETDKAKRLAKGIARTKKTLLNAVITAANRHADRLAFELVAILIITMPKAHGRMLLFGRLARTNSLSIVFGVVFVLVCAGECAAASIAIGRVYLDQSGAVHVVDTGGADHAVPKQAFSQDQKQVDAVQMQVAPDKQSAGWVVEFSGIGTNYPIGIMLQIWRDGKVADSYAEEGGFLFHAWRYFDGGAKLGFCEVPIHGDADSFCELHLAKGGKLMDKWTVGETKKPEPEWARQLE